MNCFLVHNYLLYELHKEFNETIMKSITIHGLDEKINEKITELAREKGLSLNKTIKLLLNKALGLKEQVYQNRVEDFKQFSGIWSNDDFKAFDKSIKDFGKIDKEDWK